jgi:NAD(P)H dehydrogenase (quinone)
MIHLNFGYIRTSVESQVLKRGRITGERTMIIGITSATGRLGRLVVETLKEQGRGRDVVGLVCDLDKARDLGVPTRLCDYSRPETLVSAARGLDRLLLISSNDTAERTVQNIATIQAAELAGVSLLVYTSLLHADRWSLPFADVHKATEKKLRDSWIHWVVLRNGWYIENYTAMIGDLLTSGVFHSSSRDGRVSWATRRDYAQAAVAVLTGEGHKGKVYELAGDTANSVRDFVGEISRQTGRALCYEDVSESDQIEALRKAGLSEPRVMMTALSESRAIGQNVLFDDSHALSALIGKPTTALKQAVTEALCAIGRESGLSALRDAPYFPFNAVRASGGTAGRSQNR